VEHHQTDFSRPVFVDDTGRRCSIVRTFGRAVALAFIGVVVLSAAALTGSPSASAPVARTVSVQSRQTVAVDHAANLP
jgi:hypothetical protein